MTGETKTKITAEMIKALRVETNAGVLDCRKALQESNGDFQKAVLWLREKGMAMAANRSDRETSNGLIEIYAHGGGRVGVMVEVNCETDFVARSEQFRALAHELALQIAAGSPRYVGSDDIPEAELRREADKFGSGVEDHSNAGTGLDKTIDAHLEKFKDEVCLLRQPYIRDESMTVEQLIMQNVAAIGESVIVRRFQRWELGENSPG